MPKRPVLPNALTVPQVGEMASYKISSMADAMEMASAIARHNPEVDDPDPYGYGQELEEEYGVDILSPQWKAKPADPRWIQRLKTRARKTAVARLFLQGFNPQQIADRTKVSVSTIYTDLANIGQEWRRTYLDDIEELAGKDLARLDWMLTCLGQGIENGDTKSITAAIEIIKQRSEILGYKQGVQVDIEQMVREVAEANGYDPEKAVMMASRISINMRS